MIKENKEKELQKVVYFPIEGWFAFDIILEDIQDLLDVPGIDIIWYNKNWINVVEDKVYTVKEEKIGYNQAKKIYENVLDCLEDERA